MTQELEIVLVDSDYHIDSRILAARLGYDHKIHLQSIRRHKARLEAKSALLQNEAVLKHERYQGATLQTYYMLNERQCLILSGSLKKGVEADEWHDALVDAFLQARTQVRHLESQQQHPSTPHTLTNTFRPRALENLRRVPGGYFSVMGELFKHLYNLEALINRSLDENAMIEISVGLCWSRYARDVLGIPHQHRCKYSHVCQGGRVEQAQTYEKTILVAFTTRMVLPLLRN